MKNYHLTRKDILALLILAAPLAASAQSGKRGGPPQEAFDACASQAEGAVCSFTSPHGDLSGVCMTGPRGESQLACAPEGGRKPRNANS